jgi:hypothetical protein
MAKADLIRRHSLFIGGLLLEITPLEFPPAKTASLQRLAIE